MVINFLKFPSVFKFTISSDCPSQPGYECEKLSGSASQGFLAAYFKRPPVTLTFSFIEPAIVQIQKIVFFPRIHGQSSTSVSISARRNGDSKIVHLCRGSWPPDTDVVVLDGSANFRSHRIIPYNDDKNQERPGMKTVGIRLPKNAILGELCELLLTITSTNGGNAVALKNLQIIGQPSLKIGRKEYERLAEHLRAVILQQEEPCSNYLNQSDQVKIITAPVSLNRSMDPVDTPEEFLDSLTFSLMCDPIILPSGKTIDMSSLKKHESVQEEFGRQLFDPFSGININYRQIRRDTLLQNRISDFMKLHKLPRTICANDSSDAPVSISTVNTGNGKLPLRVCFDCKGTVQDQSLYSDSSRYFCKNCALERRNTVDLTNTDQRSNLEIKRVHA